MTITSLKNPALQSIRKAAAAGRPTDDGLVVVEGPHLLEEALHGSWRIEQIFATPEAQHRHADLFRQADCEIVELSARAFASLSATETTQEVLALVRPRECAWQDLTRDSTLMVALDGIQDPGNAGTLVRSAEAFGATGVVFLKGSVRIANGKFLRATAGSIFRVPFVEGATHEDLLCRAQSAGLSLYSLTSSFGRSLDEADLRGPCVLVIGSEAAGVSHEISSAAEAIRIPTMKVESLNAAIAGSIALFVAGRQRAVP